MGINLKHSQTCSIVEKTYNVMCHTGGKESFYQYQSGRRQTVI